MLSEHKMEAEKLDRISEDLDYIKKKIAIMDDEVQDISNDLHKVRPEYLKKLDRIRKGKFHSFNTKEEFENFLENEF